MSMAAEGNHWARCMQNVIGETTSWMCAQRLSRNQKTHEKIRFASEYKINQRTRIDLLVFNGRKHRRSICANLRGRNLAASAYRIAYRIAAKDSQRNRETMHSGALIQDKLISNISIS